MTGLRFMQSAMMALLLMGLAGCMGPPERIQTMADRNYMRYAEGRSYQQVATLNPNALMGGESAYGAPIGSFLLENGDTVHRHMGASGEASSGMDLGGLVASGPTATNYRLAYFRVGPDGIVKDWAVGSIPGEASRCVRYIGGLIERCEDQSLVRQSFAVFDDLVRTSDGEPLSSWGAPAAEPAPADAADVDAVDMDAADAGQ